MFYINKINYEDMIEEFENGVMLCEIADLKFDRTDVNKDKNVKHKYLYDLRHFFSTHQKINYKVATEPFVLIKISDYVFQGYVDAIYKDDKGFYHIVDWKSSTIYQGAKAEKERGQLVLYAEAFVQLGVPLEKIKICWNFLKYQAVTINQKNGKKRVSNIERILLGEKLKSSVTTWLKHFGYEDELESYLEQLIMTNDIKCLPKDVRDQYELNDCYVYPELNQKAIDDLKNEIANTLDIIVDKTKEYKKTSNDKLFWDEDIAKESFYFSVLCGYSANKHLPYEEYLDEYNSKKSGGVFTVGGHIEDSMEWLSEL